MNRNRDSDCPKALKEDRSLELSKGPGWKLRRHKHRLPQAPEPHLQNKHRPSRIPKSIPRKALQQAGFSLVEVVIAMTVLMIGLLALTSTSVVAHSLEKADDSRQIAGQALRGCVERAHAVSIQALADDTGWSQAVVSAFEAGNLPGPEFAVAGLSPWEGESSVGTIQVITDETLSDDNLGVSLGMPRDLNGDGLVSDFDVFATGILLPVIARVRWDAGEGQREISQAFYVVGI